LRGGLVAQRGEGAFVAATNLLLDGSPTLLVVLALERRPQRRLQVIDQPIQRLFQCWRPSGGQCNRHRAMWCGEIVDVDPVRRLGSLIGSLPQQRPQRGLDACAVGTDGDDIESTHRHLGAEADRGMRTRLLGEGVQRRQLARRGEVERRDICGTIQARGRQRRDRIHARPILSRRRCRRNCTIVPVAASVRSPCAVEPIVQVGEPPK